MRRKGALERASLELADSMMNDFTADLEGLVQELGSIGKISGWPRE
jgi:hypothetical protein